MKIQITHTKEKGFIAENEYFQSINVNGDPSKGVGPMALLLVAAGTCSAIDILSILQKQKQEIKSFTIAVESEKIDKGTFGVWENIHITYSLSGRVELSKARNAAALSLEKYCSVSKALEYSSKITFDVIVNEE